MKMLKDYDGFYDVMSVVDKGLVINYYIYLKEYRRGVLKDLITKEDYHYPFTISIIIKTRKIFKYITKLNKNTGVILKFYTKFSPIVGDIKLNIEPNFIDYNRLLDNILDSYSSQPISENMTTTIITRLKNIMYEREIEKEIRNLQDKLHEIWKSNGDLHTL